MPEAPVPSALGRFDVRELLGRTERSRLYRVFDPLLAREAALRVFEIPPGLTGEEQAQARERLSGDLQGLASLRHPALVTVLETGATREFLFLEMEILEGASLDGFTAPGYLLPPRAVVQIGLATARLLEVFHQDGQVYGGLRPSQMILLPDGTLRLQDPPRCLHLPGALVAATPPAEVCAFLAPEQLTGGRAGPAADVYALGATLYALLAGEPHFHGDSAAAVIFRVLNEPPRPLAAARPDLPPGLTQRIMAALERVPHSRPKSAAEMAAALEGILEEMGGPLERLPVLAPAPRPAAVPRVAPQGPAQKSPEKPPRRRLRPAVLAGLAVLFLLWISPRLFGWDPLGGLRRPLEDGIQAATGPLGRWIRMTRPDQPLEVLTDPPGLAVQVAGGRWRLDEKGRVIAAGDETMPGLVRVVDRCREGETQVDPIDLPGRIAVPTRMKRISFEIGSDPPGADLKIDGASVPGRTPLTAELELCRDHQLELQAPGFYPARIALSAREAEESWKETLRRISLGPPAEGRLSVPSAPGYTVGVFDDSGRSHLGQSGKELALPPGRHRLTLASPEVMYRKTVVVEVRPAQTVRLAEKFPGLGRLTVYAVPPGGSVVIQSAAGQQAEVGTTPLSNYALVAGEYRVTVKHPLNATTATREVVIRGGGRETTRVGKEDWR